MYAEATAYFRLKGLDSQALSAWLLALPAAALPPWLERVAAKRVELGPFPFDRFSQGGIIVLGMVGAPAQMTPACVGDWVRATLKHQELEAAVELHTVSVAWPA
jgi:hypothetical protein